MRSGISSRAPTMDGAVSPNTDISSICPPPAPGAFSYTVGRPAVPSQTVATDLERGVKVTPGGATVVLFLCLGAPVLRHVRSAGG